MSAKFLRIGRALSLGLVAGVVVAGGLSRESHGETLEQAMAAAYAANPTLLAGRAALRAVDEGVPQAKSGWRPSLSAQLQTGYTKVENSVAGVRRQQRRPQLASLSLSQSLYNGGRVPAAIRAAENAAAAERARLVGVEQGVLLSVVGAYTKVYQAEAILSLDISNEQVLLRQLQATKDRFDVGEITRTNVHQAEARLARATADRIQAEGDLTAARAAYSNVVGNRPKNLAVPSPLRGLPVSSEQAVKFAVDRNPSVISARYNERAAVDNIAMVKGELRPSVSLTGSASRSLNSLGVSTSVDTYSAEITLSVPLYQSGAVYSRLRQARQTADQQRRLLEQARRNAIETATKAWEDLQTSRARIDSFKSQIKAAEIALEGVRREAAVGSRTVLDELNAEQELLDAKVSIVGAKQQEIVARYSLKSAIGELTAKNLALPVKFFDSKANLGKVRSKWYGGGIENGG